MHDHAIDVFHRDLAALPPRHHRVVGLWLLRAGMGALPAALCLGIAPANIAGAIATFGAFLCRPPLLALPGSLPGILFAGWIGASAAAAVITGRHPVPMLSVGPMYTWVVALLGACAFADRRTARLALTFLAVATAASTLLAIAQLTIGWRPESPLHLSPSGRRWYKTSGFSTINLTQGFVLCVLGIALLGGRSLLAPRLGVAAGAWSVIAVLLSGTRAAYLGLAAGVAGWIAAGGRRHLIAAAAVGLGILGAAAAYLAVADPQRLAATLRADDGRWAIWRVSVAVMAEHPLVGSGGPEAFKADYARLFPTVFPGAVSEFPGGAPHAHNSLLSFASRNGLPAVALYLWLIVALVRGARPDPGRSRAGLHLALGAAAAALVTGLFEDIAGHAVPAFALFVTLGLGTAMSRHQRSEPSTTLPDPAPQAIPESWQTTG